MKALFIIFILFFLLGGITVLKADVVESQLQQFCKIKSNDDESKFSDFIADLHDTFDGTHPNRNEKDKIKFIDKLGDSEKNNENIWNTFNKHYNPKKEPRKLVVFMDGTANDRHDLTNVRKLYRLAVQHACMGNPIIPYYDQGVGTGDWLDIITGGWIGKGVNRNIRDAYQFLVETYNPTDEIYLIGFSRGAFTARSLNGLIEFAGLLDREKIPTDSTIESVIKGIFYTYRTPHDGTALFEKDLKDKLERYFLSNGISKRQESIKVSAIGVFDTVPAIGGKFDEEPDDHRLQLYALNGFHALSLDERRDKFRLLRFDDFRLSDDQELKEVWFAGVHADVGGGYTKSFYCEDKNHQSPYYLNGLEHISLNWMINNFSRFNIFPKRTFPQCEYGKLNDEVFGKKKWMFREIYTRKLRANDLIHKSVYRRASAQLENFHKEREPKGKYYIMDIEDIKSIENKFTWVENCF